MGRIADEQIPTGGQVAAEPIPEQNTVDPQQLDAESFQMTAGPTRRGLRSGFNQVGAMANAFASSVADGAGLTQFAADRMKDAESQVQFADAVGPRVRDYRAVKDFEDVQEFVFGLIGQNAATMAPAVAGAMVGRGAGLRGAFAGAAAGSFIPNAGEQALRIKDTKASPQAKLGNVLATGVGTSALDMIAPGRAVGQVGKQAAKGSILKEVGKSAGLEGLTEGAQEVVGQGMHTAIEPGRDKSKDNLEVIDSTIAGVVGGGVLGGGSKVASKVASLIPSRQQTKDDVKKALDVEDKPIDEFDDTDLMENPDLNDEQSIRDAIEEKGAKSIEGLTKLWGKIKNEPWAKDVKDFITDPEQRAAFVKKGIDRFNDLEIAPKVKKGFDNIQKFVHGMRDEVERRATGSRTVDGTSTRIYEEQKALAKPKESRQRTAVDFEIYDNMVKKLHPDIAKNLTPQQKLELSDYIKYVAMYEYGKRDENEGPNAPETAERTTDRTLGTVVPTDKKQEPFKDQVNAPVRSRTENADTASYVTKREGAPTTRKRTIPEGMLQYFGKDAVTILNETNDIVANRIEPSLKRDFTPDVQRAEAAQKRRDNKFQSFVRQNLRPEIQADPEAREEAVGHAEKIYDMVEKGKFNEGQLDYLFDKEAKQRVLERFDTYRTHVTTDPEYFYEEGDSPVTEGDLEGMEVADEQAEGGFRQAKIEDVQGKVPEGAERDKRIGVPTDLDTATRWYKQLTDPKSEYDASRVSFSVQPTKDGRYTVETKDRVGDDSFSDQEWQDIREPEKYGKSGLKNGILTVKMKDGRMNKINLINLTKHAVHVTPRDDTGNVNYLYDMVSRGLSKLLSDPRVVGFSTNTEEKLVPPKTMKVTPTDGKFKGQQREISISKGFDLPDDTPVAYLNKRVWTWKDVKDRIHLDTEELDLKQTITNLVEKSQAAPNIEAIEHYIIPRIEEKTEQLAKEYHEAFVKAAKKGASGKDKALRNKLAGRVARVRNAEDQVLEEIDRRMKEGDEPRHEIKGLVEDERIRGTTAAETPVGKRTVEGDTGVTTQGNLNRGPTGELDAGMKDRAKQHKRGSYQGKVLTEDEYRDELDTNAELSDQRRERNVQTPSAVKDKGPLAPNLPFGEKETSRLRFNKITGEPIPHDTKSKPKAKLLTDQQRADLTGEGTSSIDGKQIEVPDNVHPSDLYKAGHSPEDASIFIVAHISNFVVNDQGRNEIEPNIDKTLRNINQDIETGKYKNKELAWIKDLVKKLQDFDTKRIKLIAPIKPKKSTQNVGVEGDVSHEEMVAVRAELQRVLGPDLAVKFLKKMSSAGSFISDEAGVETIRIHAKALDAMGVGRHEAAHALFERLVKADPKMAQVLLAAAGSPTIITRLRTLLQGHTAALEQLTDPEERLAYMYQFWASKLLTVGPNTKTVFDKVKGFLRQVAGIWSETFRHVENMDKAEKVFELFNAGHFADKNAVRQVLEREFPKTRFERATEIWPQAMKFFSKAFLTADGRIRNTNIPAFIAIADLFYTPVGEQQKGPGYLQTRYMVMNRLQSKLHDIMENVNEADHATILGDLRSGKPASHPKAAAIQALLNEIFRYMHEKQVKVVEWNQSLNDGKGGYEEHDLKYVQNYMPRYYDRQKIFDDQTGFIRTLITPQPGYETPMSLADAQMVMAKILRSSKIDPQENDFSAGLTFFAPNAQHRTLPVPDSILAPWFHQDLMGTMYSYMNYVTRRAEYASRFGNQGKVIERALGQAEAQGASVEDIRTFNQSVMALEGSLGHAIKPELKQILGGIATYQNYRLLPLALLTSLVDSIGIGVRGGGVEASFKAFTRGVRDLIKENKDNAYHLAKVVGTISASHDAHMLADAYGTQYLTGWQRKANNFLFKWNGMEQWNRSMRVAATATAERFIIRHATSPTEHSERYLRELGLTTADIRMEGGSLVLDEKMKQAIAQWVDGAILRPNAAIRPVWMSDPHWMLVAHLKQFTYSFQKIIIARVVHEIENGNMTPAYYIMSYVPLLIASDMLRMMITPGQGDNDKMEKYGMMDWLNRGVQRAGLLGPGQYAVDSYGDLGHGKLPVTSLLGPSAQQLWDLGAAAAGRGSLGLELKKAVPGYMLVK